MIYAATRVEIEARKASSANGGSSTAPSPTAWSKPATVSVHRLRTSQWRSTRTTNAIERLREQFKRRIKTQTMLPSAKTAAMLFWALPASGPDQHAQG
jgi:putative transposase